jgi:hypothetical protein
MNTAAFSAGTKNVKRDIAGLANTSGVTAFASSVTAGIAAAKTFIDTALSVTAGIRSMVMETIDHIDTQAALADRLGTTIDRLTALQFAVKITDGEVESLSKSIEKMTINLGKAAQGGQAAKTFQRLGLDVAKLRALDPVDALLAINDAISKLPTPAEVAAARVEIFGKSVGGIVTTLEAGSAEIRRLQQEAERLGFTLSEKDAQAAGRADDALKRLEATTGALTNKMTSSLAPALSEILEAFNSLELASINIGDALSSTIGAQTFLTTLQAAGDAIAPGLGTGMIEVGRFIHDAQERQAELTTETKNTAAAVNEINSALEHAEGPQSKLLERLEQERDLFGLTGRQRQVQEAALAGASDSELAKLREVAAELDAMEAAQKRLADLESAAAGIIEQSLTPLDEYFKKLERIAEVQEAGLLTATQTAAAHEKAREELEKAEAAAAEANKSALEKSAAARVDELKTPFERMRDDLGKIQEEFAAGLLTSAQKDLAELLARREFLQTQPEDEADTGAQRPGALERGTAAAFSASFGPVAKPIDRLAKLTEQILQVQRQIDAKLGGTVDF